MLKSTLTILIFGLLCSCQKYAGKIEGENNGQMTRNDTLIDQNTSVNLTEVDKKRISTQSDYFNTYLTYINKKGDFASVSYNSTDNNESLELEIYDDGLIVLLHRDEHQNSLVFNGQKN